MISKILSIIGKKELLERKIGEKKANWTDPYRPVLKGEFGKLKIVKREF